MPMRMPVHQPVGRTTKQDRDRAYARTRDRASVVLYHSARWLKARVRFLRSHPLCAECERNGVIRTASVVDHVDPHRGDATVFWDESRWQALCASCHGKKTVAKDGGFGNPRR